VSNAYLIVSGRISDKATVEEYKSLAGPVLKKHNAILPPENYKVSNVLAGDSSPEFLLRIPFPTTEDINKAFADPEYLKVISLRDKGFSELSIYSVS